MLKNVAALIYVIMRWHYNTSVCPLVFQ